MLHAAGFMQIMKELMSAIVWNFDNECCMYSCCPAGPGKDALLSIFESALDMEKVEDIHVFNTGSQVLAAN